jgi:hypothetical protein
MDKNNRFTKVARWLPTAVVVAFTLGQVSFAQDVASFQAEVQAAANPSNQDHIGQAPENNSQQFLREDTILLKSGQWQLDVGLSYLIDEKPFTQLAVTQPGNTVTAVNGILNRRLLVSDFAFRYGISDRLQFFADLPVGWTNTEIASLGSDNYFNAGGLGDTSVGASYLWHKSCGSNGDPDVIVTAGLTAPTSHEDFLANLLVTPQATLGQGFWAAYWSILFVQTYDPIIVFYGFGSRHAFTREEDGLDVQAGDQYLYRFGVGFAVNERVTLSSTLTGAYITEPRINGQIVPGTSMEPVYLRCAVTLAQCQRICEPFVEFGVTNDAANTRFGIVWTF